MLGGARIVTQIPVVDLARARRFYTEVLGLTLLVDKMPGLALLEGTGGQQLMLFERPPSKADHTVVAFVVDDVAAMTRGLRALGVTFEHYVLPGGIETDADGVATMGPAKAAWFKDTEGNLLALNNKLV